MPLEQDKIVPSKFSPGSFKFIDSPQGCRERNRINAFALKLVPTTIKDWVGVRVVKVRKGKNNLSAH